MTSATPTVLPLPPAADRGSPAKPVTIWRVIQSEWIKFSTLRSTWITLAFAVIGVIGIGAIITAVTASNWDSQDAASVATFDTFDPIGTSLTGVVLAQLIMAVMGVLIVTGEYATGMIRASLAAVPRRLMLLSGKITVAAVVSLTVSLIATFAAFLIGQQLLGDHGTTLDAPGVLRAVFGSALYLSSIAVIAAAIGFIVRSTAGGVAATLGLLLVLPLLSDSIPNDWVARALQYLPSEAGMAIYLGSAGWGSDFTLTRAVTTVMAWVVVTIAGAAVVLVRRDA